MPLRAPKHRPPSAGGRKHLPPGADRQARRALHTGSAAWARLRAVVLTRDLYTCAHCGLEGDEVDHVDGDSHHNALHNLQVLCASCHSVKTAREHGGRSPR